MTQASGEEELHTRVDGLEKSAAVVKDATGHTPNMTEPSLVHSLTRARSFRKRQQAKKERKWNTAMNGMAEEIERVGNWEDRLELQFELAQLNTSSGQLERAMAIIKSIEEVMVGRSFCQGCIGRGLGQPMIIQEKGKVLSRLGQLDELEALIERAQQQRSFGLVANLQAFKKEILPRGTERSQPSCIDGYALWMLASVSPVSNHSAIFHFESKDFESKDRQCRGRTMWHKTWHTTLLAMVGPNKEGPLPWVERDYTPISNGVDWENGQCDILIKVYNDGTATSWLHKQPLGSHVWMSQPEKTMSLPSFVLDNTQPNVTGIKYEGVLLVLAGTGIVAAAQVLQHTTSATTFGTSRTCAKPPLNLAIRLIYACREDDVTMIDRLCKWCSAEGNSGLQQCLLALSSSSSSAKKLPYPNAARKDLETFQSLSNVSVLRSRVTREAIARELKALQALGPCKVVVSGPETFNAAVRGFLSGLLTAQELQAGGPTILSA